MKDKLIELLEQHCLLRTDALECSAGTEIVKCSDCLATFLIKNDVVLPPCKVGDVVYYIDVSIEPNERGKWVTRKRIKAYKFDYSVLDWIDTPIYLTKSEAEAVLKKGGKKEC